MLKAVGIVAEYNPFHNGHKYQINMAKKQTNADVSVVIMSGNWVQRGQPALVDKWTRTKMALNNGADLVLELPVQYAVQPVDIFATHAIKILNHMKCSYLSFGSENPDIDFDKLSNLDLNMLNTFHNNYCLTYSEIVQKAILEETGINVSQPNDILGLNYAMANYKMGRPLKLFPIQRISSKHNSVVLNSSSKFTSASSIRREIIDNHVDQIASYIPRNINQKDFQKVVSWNDFWPLLKYKIITTDLEDLANIYQMTEGLQYRLKKFVMQSKSFNEFIDLIKTKRYTYPRIQRLLVYTLLNWQWNAKLPEDCVRILGFNSYGRHYVKQVKKSLDVPIISKVDKKAAQNELKLNVIAGKLYGDVVGNSQDFGRKPIIF